MFQRSFYCHWQSRPLNSLHCSIPAHYTKTKGLASSSIFPSPFFSPVKLKEKKDREQIPERTWIGLWHGNALRGWRLQLVNKLVQTGVSNWRRTNLRLDDACSFKPPPVVQQVARRPHWPWRHRSHNPPRMVFNLKKPKKKKEEKKRQIITPTLVASQTGWFTCTLWFPVGWTAFYTLHTFFCLHVFLFHRLSFILLLSSAQKNKTPLNLYVNAWPKEKMPLLLLYYSSYVIGWLMQVAVICFSYSMIGHFEILIVNKQMGVWATSISYIHRLD